MCKKMPFSVLRSDCRKINAKTNISNQNKKTFRVFVLFGREQHKCDPQMNNTSFMLQSNPDLYVISQNI